MDKDNAFIKELDDLQNIKFLIEQHYKEVTNFWTRTNIFVAISVGVLSALIFWIFSEKPTNQYLLFLISIAGIIFCLIWFQVNKMSRYYEDRWLYDARRLAERNNKLYSIFFLSLGFREQKRYTKDPLYWFEDNFLDQRRPKGWSATKCVSRLIILIIIIWSLIGIHSLYKIFNNFKIDLFHNSMLIHNIVERKINMSSDQIANWLIAIGTLLIAILAIWGDILKNKIAGPKLLLSLIDTKNEKVINDQKGIPNHFFYHLKVKNKRKVLASNVRVNLINVYKENSNKILTKKVLASPLELHWQYHYKDSNGRPIGFTIGPERICDLGSIWQNKNFELSTHLDPKDNSTILLPDEKMKIEIIATGDNAKSNTLFLEVFWDGKWSKDSNEMSKHLIIKEI